jgi:hypothetical protein
MGQDTLMRLFRERLLARLVDKHAISQELAKRLISWTHPGFSAHVGEPIAADDTQALENVAGYAVRNPLSLQRLVYLDGQLAVIYKGLKHNPTLGRNFETMDPLQWLARMSDHIPDPGRYRTHFYAYYAHRVRGDRAAAAQAGQGSSRRSSTSIPSHARSVGASSRSSHTCTTRSPSPESSITSALARPRPPNPPALHGVVRVPVDEQGREIEGP